MTSFFELPALRLENAQRKNNGVQDILSLAQNSCQENASSLALQFKRNLTSNVVSTGYASSARSQILIFKWCKFDANVDFGNQVNLIDIFL